MASTRDLKKRITSTKNTQQTTRAMKLVSAAKLRRAQEAILSQRPYAKNVARLMKVLSKSVADGSQVPLLRSAPLVEGSKKVLLVSLSSDRGLCGGFNTNIVKTTQRWIQSNSANYAEVRLMTVGKKVSEVLRGKKGINLVKSEEVGGKVAVARAKKLADYVVEQFTSGEVDEVKFVYNEFKNAISQIIVVEDLLPLAQSGVSSATATKEEVGSAEEYLLRPSAEVLMESLLEKHFVVQVFRILLESQASEHGARMSAMENATKNAGEMIKKLTLQYNKQRQAGITKELLEIIAGSESQSAEA